jgi:cytochrome c oxidase subunit 4
VDLSVPAALPDSVIGGPDRKDEDGETMSAHAVHGAHADHHGKVHAHVSTPLQLLAVFGALLVLTVITVWVSRGPFDFGWISLFIALVVASVKAMLVMLFFMHLSHDYRFNMLAFLSGYLFLALFLFFALLDSSQYQREIRDFQIQEVPATAPGAATGS